MVVDIERLQPPPNGFPRCKGCPYLDYDSVKICYPCAMRAIEGVAESRCEICDHPIEETAWAGECSNPVCSYPRDSRYFERVWAIGMKAGYLERVIWKYKLDGKKAWAWILGRVLVGYLDANRRVFEDFDLIVGSPTFVGAGGRSWDHIGLIIERAAIESSGRWPFDIRTPPAIIKTAATPSIKSMRWAERRDTTEGVLREALSVPRPSRVAGKRILVFDDIFTEGLTIREVARALILAGAAEVSEIVLARQRFTPKD